MDDGATKQKINIDPQKDFKAAVVGDKLSGDNIKDFLKKIDFKKIIEEMPLKKMRHDAPVYNKENIGIIIPPFDMSGSMGSTLGHEMPHISANKTSDEFGLYSKKIFEKGKVIVFDEIDKAGAGEELQETIARLTDLFDGFKVSQARGREMADSFQQGAAQPVAVRRPVTFRPRATA